MRAVNAGAVAVSDEKMCPEDAEKRSVIALRQDVKGTILLAVSWAQHEDHLH